MERHLVHPGRPAGLLGADECSVSLSSVEGVVAMKILLRSGAVAAAVGVGLSLAVLPAGPAGAAGGTHVRCNDITGLKNAITQANTSGGRIILASHCTYTLTTPATEVDGLPPITGKVTISGRDTTIRRAPDATTQFRVLRVVAGGHLTLNSLTVSGGRIAFQSGGGIENEGGTLNLNRTLIKGNSALSGGGLLNLGGQLRLDHSTVERNVANYGGGIRNDGPGTVTMKGGSLLNNRAFNSDGGGLLTYGGTTSLDSVSVRGNTALHGGGIEQFPGSILRLTSTTLRDNIAVSGAALSSNGGTATLVRSLVTHNTAITAGGGIFTQNSGQVTLTSSRVIRNAPDNCSPEGSVPGCTNPANRITPSSSQLPPPAKDSKARK
ncbi:hypothetical protein G4Z16_24595 [Streptomyces bathyalis]|uniref:Right handed beta helix domain-containing protein n=1 Tax=Streptomyces bathyalis TaxID=2710756 RepID=A0A7T1T9Y8_9ACTN|nr:hypothetical protein [Streptomyces bathyalis]QPP09063.1 hypothetical protein G4Z16_24595 [Streptomyces bathyalis]